MITLNQTAGDNNETIWVLKINTSTPILVSTKALSISDADENAIIYDGQALNRNNYLSELSFGSNVISGGGTGSVTSFGFSISRYVNNTSLDGFFEEFYPVGTEYLTSKIVDLGVVWSGATLDTDITWLFRGRIIDYSYEQRQLNLTVFQESEISNKEVPYYVIQKDFDNEISYFANAPEDSYGVSIPIAYGDLTTGAQILGYIDTRLDYGNLCPCIKTSKTKNAYIVTSHKCHTVSADNVLWGNVDAVVYFYIPNLSTYMAVYNRDDSADAYTNNIVRYTFDTQYTRGVDNLKGFCRIKLTADSKDSDVDIDLVADNDVTNYAEIDNNEVCALKMADTASTSDIGFLSNLNTTDVQIFFDCSNDGSGTYNLEITYKNYTQTSSSGSVGSTSVSTETAIGYEIGQITTAKKDAEAWTIEELTSLDYLITNKSGSAGQKIRVYYAFIQLDNIFVITKNQARRIRNNSGRNV